MTKAAQQEKAKRFLALHVAPSLLILPNAWDVSSAKIFEVEGFKAIGTPSAGIAATLGYPDGQRISLAETIAVVRRIVQHTDLPVSADIEAGYANSIEGVVNTALEVLKAGAVGLNLEDSTSNPATPLFEVEFQTEKIRAIRKMALAEGIDLVINARTDVYLLSDKNPAAQLQQTIERANSYREAGADCIFVPDVGNLEKQTLDILVREIDAPINLIAGASTPSIAELEQIGIARVSLGPRPMRALLTFLRKIAQELLETGTYGQMASSSITYSEVNSWFE